MRRGNEQFKTCLLLLLFSSVVFQLMMTIIKGSASDFAREGDLSECTKQETNKRAISCEIVF